MDVLALHTTPKKAQLYAATNRPFRTGNRPLGETMGAVSALYQGETDCAGYCVRSPGPSCGNTDERPDVGSTVISDSVIRYFDGAGFTL